MDKQLQRLLDLSRKTGDRLIAFDPRGEKDAYVVMGIDDYENLAIGRSEVRGLTEEELLDKINRDVAIWKSDKELDNNALKSEKFYPDEDSVSEGFEGIENDWYSIEDIAKNSDIGQKPRESEESTKERKRSGAWKIPSDRLDNAEEVIDEDRYYLEDVED